MSILSKLFGKREPSLPVDPQHELRVVNRAGDGAFEMAVSDAFHIKPIKRVILVGVISQGIARPGDDRIVVTGAGEIPVHVEKLEHPETEEIASASQGDQIGLMLSGIEFRQINPAELVKNPAE